MDLIDEQQVARLKVHQQTHDVARSLQRRSTGDPALNPELLGQHQGHRGFTETRWAVEQHMIQGLTAALSRLHRNAKHLFQLGLTDVVGQLPRAETFIDADRRLLGRRLSVQDPLRPGLGRAGVGGNDRHAGRVPSSG
ncbi:MAG: Uncharacterised protein [Synechococcus sp. CC9902]|nr:MAG: Uncharacterised protein [Synechococcus sp. CC9902]